MRKEVLKDNKINVILTGMTGLILFFIGLDIAFHMAYFPIDNPGILVAGKSGWSAVAIQFASNPRLDFMYNIIIFLCASVAGNTPTVYYMVQYLFYLVTIMAVLYFGHLQKTDYKISLFSASLLIWCSSVGENLYTIGKKEIFLTAGIAISLICLYRIVFLNDKGWKKALLYCIYVFNIVFVITLKETSNIIICMALLFLVYTVIFNRPYIKKAFIGFMVVICIILMSQGYKKIFVTDSNYTSYQISVETISENIKFYFLYHKDVCLIGVISLINSLVHFIKERKNAVYAYLLIINITGWGYVGGLCLWRWPQSYYLYPAILFFAMSLCSVKTKAAKKKKNSLILSIPLCCALFVAIVYGSVYNYCITQSHKDLSIAYTGSIEKLCENVKEGDRIIIDSANLYEEPPFQMKNLLVDYLEKPVEIWGGRQNIWNEEVTDDRLLLYGYTREQYEKEKKSAKPQIGDFIVHYVNNRNYFGPSRFVNPSATLDIISCLERQGYVMVLFDEFLTQRKLPGRNGESWEIQNAEAGYQIWKVLDIQSGITGLGIDGWSGKSFCVENYKWGEHGTVYVSDIGSAITLDPENTVDIYVDNQLNSTIGVSNGTTISLDEIITPGSAEKHEIKFDVTETFIPSEFLKDSNDNRVLGINIVYSRE